MANQSTNVFVSYSHADASLVGPVVKLLRVNKSLVFQDVDDIQPGKKWRGEIARGLADSHLVVVFWCEHASRSEEVSNEWKAAIEQEKDLLPLLLDATPLPTELNDFQWIDFRGTVGRDHGSSASPNPQSSAASRPLSYRRSVTWRILAGVSVILVAAASLFAIFAEKTSYIQVPPDAPAANFQLNYTPLLIALVVLLTGLAGLAWGMRRLYLRWRQTKRLRARQQTLAAEIETEILRRSKRWR